MQIVNMKILLFIAMLVSGIAVTLIGIKQHMDAAVQEHIEVDRTYDDRVNIDMQRMRQQIERAGSANSANMLHQGK